MGAMSAIASGTGAATLQSSVPDGTEFDNLVGAYYYGWYGPDFNGGFHWEGDLGTADGRSHTPVLGEYSSHDQAVVDQHIAWALNHGINWFNCTWWGPDRFEEETILDYLLDSQHAEKMHFSLLYEPLGRDLGNWADFGASENRQRLQEDLQYIEDTFFDDPNWLHIDGRPVVYFWINRQFTGDVTGAFEDAISTLNTEPYIVGDNVTHAEPFDAVANFATVGSTTSDWDTYVDNTRDRRELRLKQTTYGTDQDYIPSVQPGASWPDPILEHDADRFRDVCQIMAEAMDDDLQAAIVCSFNEWHEGSTLEPAEEYGTSALEVVDEELQGASTSGDFLTGEYAGVRFDFSDVVRPADVSDSGDVRPLAFWLDQVRLEAADGSTVLSDTIESSNDAAVQTDPAVAGISGRWFGTPLGVGSLVFERSALEEAETLVLRGHAYDGISDLRADVSVNGKDMGTYSLGATNQEYEFSIPAEIPGSDSDPERAPYNGPHPVPGTVEAEDYDIGGEGVAYHDTTSGNTGGAYRDDDVDIEPSTEHGYNVGWIEGGEWLEYTVQVEEADEYDLTARVASGADGGRLSVSAEGESVSASFGGTGGWQSWTSVDLGTVSLSAGETVLRVDATDGSWNCNYLEVETAGADDGSGGDEEGLQVVDDSTARLVWQPDFEVRWPGYVYAGPTIDGDPRDWQLMDETSDNEFEVTLDGLAAGDEVAYTFSYYDEGWQYTGRVSETFQPDGDDGSDGDGTDDGASGAGTSRLDSERNELPAGEHLESNNGEYRLYLQAADGNLVLRATSTGDAEWASGTAGDGATRVTLQGDGNLVMYTDGGDAVWASHTAGSGADELVLEDDGALVLYADGSQVWAVNE